MANIHPLGAPSGGFLVCANPLLIHCRRFALLQTDLIHQWLVNRPGAIRLNIAEQSGGAVTVVHPARVVGDRVPADALHRYSECPCLRHLPCQVAQPERSLVRLNARFSDEHRSPIPGMDVAQDVVKRAVPGVIHLNPGPAIDPLIVRVVVHPDNVDVLRLSAQLRPQPSGDVVPDLKLACDFRRKGWNSARDGIGHAYQSAAPWRRARSGARAWTTSRGVSGSAWLYRAPRGTAGRAEAAGDELKPASRPLRKRVGNATQYYDEDHLRELLGLGH